MNKSWWIHIFTLVLVVGVIGIVYPLFGRKYIPTHDGEYHIIRIVEFSRMLEEGYVLPRWAPNLNSGYGIPIFNFHYPLPNYVGSFIRDLITHDAVYAFQYSAGIGYVLLVIGVYLWLSGIFGVLPALVGATAAGSVPYLLVDMFIRGSIGEVWAFVFFFFTLFSIEKRKNLFVALSLGLLIISHNILGMIFTPFLFLYAFVRNKQSVVWFFGGLGLSAFFWIPALFEQKYVAGLNTVNFRDYFVQPYELLIPSWGSGFSTIGNTGNKMSLQLGVSAIFWIIASLFFYRTLKQKSLRSLYGLFLGVFILIVFLTNPISILVWELVKPIQYIQYPWRLLSFMLPISAFSAAVAAQAIKRKWILFIVSCASLLLVSSYRPVLYEPRNEAYYLARQNFTDGTSSMGNSFSTIWTPWKETRASQEIVVEKGFVTSVSRWKYLEKSFSVMISANGLVSINMIYFPGWTVLVDHSQIALAIDKKGIIEFPVPLGFHTIDVIFKDTKPRIIGN
jgi:hypothetical protein